MLSSRQKAIIKTLESDTWIKGQVLANKLDVTTRTIRSDIEKINSIIPELIESHTRKGYFLHLNKMESIIIDQSDRIPQSPSERIYYIIHKLLIDKETMSFFEIKNKLFVSSFTIESDIRKIREMIKPFTGLKLIRRNNELYFQGSEHSKRKLYRSLLNNEIQDDFLNLNKIASLYDNFDLMAVFKILEEVLEEYDYQVRKTALPMLVIHIGISIERMLSGYYVENVSFAHSIDQEYEYKISHDFYSRVTNLIPIKFNEDEVLALAGLLLGYKNVTLLNDDVCINGKSHNIPQLIEKILKYIEEVFNIDFSHDYDFINGLQLHIQSFIERASRDIKIPNVHLQDIKESYPFFFEMSIHISKLIGKELNLEFSEEETGFIAIHLGAAYERYEANKRYRAILLTTGNDTFTFKALEKINTTFGDRVEIIKVVDYYTEEIKEHSIDLIISLVPQFQIKTINTVIVSTFMSNQDISKILLALNNLDKKRNKSILSSKLPGILDPQLFHSKFKAESVEKTIATLCDDLYAKGYVKESYKESVFKREAIVATSFEQGLAIPHPLELESLTSKISVAILDEPLLWGQYEVSLIMLLSINEQDRHVLWSFFEWLSDYTNDNESITALTNSDSYEEFLEKILEA